MVDVDGVLVHGRPEDGLPWHTSLQQDFGFSSAALHEHFFTPYWQNIVLGRSGLMDDLATALKKIAPHLSAETFVAYWFEKDSRLATPLLQELASLRAMGTPVYLATNQEHLRAAYLMNALRLADHVDGIFYSAQLGVKKPDTEFFSSVQTSIGLRGEEILLIDDSPENIAAALEAGWQALHWTAQTPSNILRTLYK